MSAIGHRRSWFDTAGTRTRFRGGIDKIHIPRRERRADADVDVVRHTRISLRIHSHNLQMAVAERLAKPEKDGGKGRLPFCLLLGVLFAIDDQINGLQTMVSLGLSDYGNPLARLNKLVILRG